MTTVVQIGMFAILMPRSDFDEYAVWVTSAQFLVGVAQAVGSDRVVVGRRSVEDGTRAARVLCWLVAVAQLAVAAALGSIPLMLCSLAALAYVYYDYQRMVGCFDRPRLYLRTDVGVLATQVLAVLLLAGLIGRSEWLALAWWLVALPLWLIRSDDLGGGVRAGLRVLRLDARESAPLLLDAVLAGVPMVVALSLAHSQGGDGVASGARMALTILGPITVLGLAGRRLVYAHVASGQLGPRFHLTWAGVVSVCFLTCTGLLVLTRTPLYPWAFPGFEALTWLAILAFALNHSAMLATFLPAATLRASGRSHLVGAARVVAATASLAAGIVVAPFDDPSDVGWCVGIGSLGYAVALYLLDALLPERAAVRDQPEPAAS